MLQIEFAQLSDPGRQREQNEDFLGYAIPDTPDRARSHGWLFALADGIGGHDRGEVASRTAIESVIAGFRSASSGDSHTSLIPRLVQAANGQVIDAGHAVQQKGAAMGTTIVTCALRFDRAVVGHVGDSRCYLIRDRNVTILTRDHTFANEQVRLGVMSAEEAANAPTKHVLSRSLGNGLFVNVDISDQQIFAGDILMLCSDGLHGAISTPDLAALLTADQDLQAAARRLIDLANERDGSDNCSVQLIRVLSVERMGMYRGRPYKLR